MGAVGLSAKNDKIGQNKLVCRAAVFSFSVYFRRLTAVAPQKHGDEY